MAFDTFKDLKKGDRVKFENAINGLGRIVSGESVVIGFGHGGYQDMVWVEKEGGGLQSLLYEDVKKI